MSIDFYSDAIEVTNRLKKANSQPDCERIILGKIKDLVQDRKNDEQINLYLKRLSIWLENKMAANRLHGECANFRQSVGIINELFKMSTRKTWIKTIDMR